jgi:ribosomal protein S18 acetylase RimI-like enzyme
MPRITLRPATGEDVGFLYDLHRTALRDYVEQTYGLWDDTWQQQRFRHHCQVERCSVICSEGQDAGVVCVHVHEDEVFLTRIEILPEFQRRGLGTQVIQSILREAFDHGKAVRLQTFKVNPARKLYARLGFRLVGETETHDVMRATPPGAR